MIYHHTGASYPGDHNASVTCSSCHTSNSATIVYSSAAYAPDCAGCHARQFSADAHPKWESPTTVFYSVSELRDCTGACHIYTDSSMTTIKERRTGHHHVNSGSFGG